jgi:hypothetical protein
MTGLRALRARLLQLFFRPAGGVVAVPDVSG